MLIELLKAFLVGGAICAIGQIFIDYTKLTPARILTGYVVAGVILSAVGLYKPLADFAGAEQQFLSQDLGICLQRESARVWRKMDFLEFSQEE